MIARLLSMMPRPDGASTSVTSPPAFAAHADDVDVAVLAQASMAPAADLVGDLSIPVLSSPRLAVLRAVELADA